MITGLVALLASCMRPARRAHRETGSDTRAAEALAEMRAANMAEEAEHQRLFAECSLPAMDVEFYSHSYIAPRYRCECDPHCTEDFCAPCRERELDELLDELAPSASSRKRECCDRCGENETPAISVCLRCDKKLCEWCMMFEEDVCNACYEKSLGGVA